MAQVGGYRPGGGRPKGSKNKRTLAKLAAVDEKLEKLGVDPIEAMALVVKDELMLRMSKDPEERDRHDPKLMMEAAKELAQYVAPKRKAVEMTGTMGVMSDDGKMTKSDALNRFRIMVAAAREAASGDE